MIIQTTANDPLKAVIFSFRAPAIPSKNIFFLRLSNTFQESITLIPRNLYAEISQLIKDKRYFNCKERGYTMLNCLEKTKISTITNISNIDNIENIDQGKE